MDDDVIGSEPDRAPRARRSARRVRLPGVLARHPRPVAVFAALLAVIAVVTISRAGVGGLRAATPPPPPPVVPPLPGEVLALAAGQTTIYAVVDDCRGECRVRLVTSADDGRSWTELALPGPPPTVAAVQGWTLAVSGNEDRLSIQDAHDTTIVSGYPTQPFAPTKIVPGPALDRVPATREPLVSICPKTRCTTPALEFVDPRDGTRGLLAHQPPFPPAVLSVVGGQLWTAGIEPGSKRWAVAVSIDDATTWKRIPLPSASTDPRLQPLLAPVPESQTAYFLQGYGNGTSYSIWVVPAPPDEGTRTVPFELHPRPGIAPVAEAVGIKDGRLMIDPGPVVLTQGGGQDRAPVSDVDSSRYVLRDPIRGPHQLLIANAVRTDGAASIATTDTGNPNDWDVRPIVLH